MEHEAQVISPIEALAMDMEQTKVIPVSVAGALAKSETEAQLDAAHRYKRSITRFLQETRALATVTREVAESCIYALPRDGKTISGPSVRLAEIVASSYGNLHVAARIVDIDDAHVVAQGVAWDLEKNLRTTIEVRRKITGKNGRRFSDDMITVTGNAAASIALRNAIFRVVPRAYVDQVYLEAKRVAVGDAKTLSTRRQQLLERFLKMGVTPEKILAKLDRKGVEEIDLEDVEKLIGIGTAIKDGTLPIDEAFPEPAAAAPAPATQDGRRISMKQSGKADASTDEKPTTDRGTDPEAY